MTGDELRVGLIGFGAIGRVHAWAHENLKWYYDNLPVATRITHVATSRRESAEAAKAVTGAAHAGTDAAAICTSPDVDLVHICTPNHLHAQTLRTALDHGKLVYCDKPLVAWWAEAQALRRDYPKALERSVGMTFQWRFFPATMLAATLLAEGRIGRILSFRACYLHGGSSDPDAPLKWKLSGEAGGGVIADLASHVVDLLAAFGARYRSVTARTSIAYDSRPVPGSSGAGRNAGQESAGPSEAGSGPPESAGAGRARVDAEDHVVALVEATFPGSGRTATGTIEATKIATGTEDEMRFEIHGSEGAIRFNSLDLHHLEVYETRASGAPAAGLGGFTRLATGQRYPAPARAFPSPKATIGLMRSHVACLAESVCAFAEGRAPRPNGLDGVYVQHILDAMGRSARDGTAISIDESLAPMA